MTSYLCFALSVLHSTCEMRAGHNLGYLCCYYCVGSCGWHCAVVAMSMSHRLILDEFDFTNLNFALMDDGWPLFTSCGSGRKRSLSQDSIAATMSTHHPDSIGSILVRSSPYVLACCRNFMHVWLFMDRVCLWALKLKGSLLHTIQGNTCSCYLCQVNLDTRLSIGQILPSDKDRGLAICSMWQQHAELSDGNFTKTKGFMSFFEFQFEARHSVIALAWGLAVLA